MPGLRWFAQRHRIEERGEPEAPASAHHREALDHEGAVQPVQGHHVGDRGERDEVEPVLQVRHPLGRRPGLPQASADGHESQEDHARCAEMAEAR